eukprot:9484815-Pyramimonas_sp.AAC.2
MPFGHIREDLHLCTETHAALPVMRLRLFAETRFAETHAALAMRLRLFVETPFAETRVVLVMR